MLSTAAASTAGPTKAVTCATRSTLCACGVGSRGREACPGKLGTAADLVTDTAARHQVDCGHKQLQDGQGLKQLDTIDVQLVQVHSCKSGNCRQY